MGNDDITLVSTTDSPEQVQAALTEKPVKPAEPEQAAEPAKEPATPAEPAAETPEQKEERETKEASEAGGRLSKRRQSIQQEIDDLTRNKYSVRRDVEAEESRLAELRQQRAQLETAPAAPSESPKADAKKQAETRQEPKLDALDEEGNAKYSTYEDYLTDYGKWIKEEATREARSLVEQERNTERARIEHASADRAVKERLAQYNESLEEFKKTHADFDAVFEDARAEVQDALVALGPEALKVVDGYTIFDAQDAPALTYYLLKHPDELKSIASRAPQQQLISLVRIEERLRAEGASTPARPHAAPETKAPAPIKPVGAGPTATTVPLDEEPFQDYKARRERELKARRSA